MGAIGPNVSAGGLRQAGEQKSKRLQRTKATSCWVGRGDYGGSLDFLPAEHRAALTCNGR